MATENKLLFEGSWETTFFSGMSVDQQVAFSEIVRKLFAMIPEEYIRADFYTDLFTICWSLVRKDVFDYDIEILANEYSKFLESPQATRMAKQLEDARIRDIGKKTELQHLFIDTLELERIKIKNENNTQ